MTLERYNEAEKNGTVTRTLHDGLLTKIREGKFNCKQFKKGQLGRLLKLVRLYTYPLDIQEQAIEDDPDLWRNSSFARDG